MTENAYAVTLEDIRRSLRATPDDQLKDMEQYLQVWEGGIQKTSESQGWRFFRTLRLIVRDEILRRNHGLHSLEETDVCRLVATLATLRDAVASRKPTAELPPGPAAFWGLSLVFVDQEKRRRWADAREIEIELAELPVKIDGEIRKLLEG